MAKKFLIIRFSSIGDIVLATPAIRCLRKKYPDDEIHFLTKQSFKIVTESNPYINKFFYYNDNIDVVIEELKKENYDYVIDLHNNIRSNKIKLALKAKSYTVNKLSIQKFLLTKLKLNVMPGQHITQRSINTMKALGVVDDGLGLDYFIPEKDVVKTNDIPTSHQAGFVAIVIGASYYTKKLPVYKLQELCTKIDHPVILIGGKEDYEEGEAIRSVDEIKVYNACGKFNLNESADLVRQSKLVISHDTGLQYIACAFKKQVLAVWGGTSPKLDVEPYYGSVFMQHQQQPIYENIVLNLFCQPCSKYGTKKCPLGHFKCMNNQDIDALVNKAHLRLGKSY